MTQELQKFIEVLYALNQTMKKLFESGDVGLFTEMNGQIKEMYRLQHGNNDPIMQAIDIDCDIIYHNFDMIVAVLRTTEEGVIDRGAQTALNKFLHNIDDSVVSIASTLGVA